MRTYSECKALAATRKRKIANNTYLVVRDDGGFGIKFHDTEVVIHYPTKTVFNSGGYKTVSTKARINEFSTASLSQCKGVWTIDGHPFADGITIFASGYVTGKGQAPKKTADMRKKVNAYAKEYAELLCSGKMDKPSGGDCWCCLMGMDGADHIRSHIKESYFVPSLINQVNRDNLSPFTGDFIARIMQGIETSDWQRGIAFEQIKRAVQQYCLHELGLPA